MKTILVPTDFSEHTLYALKVATSIAKEVKDIDELVLFGFANMKKELEKHIRNDTTLVSKLRVVASADSMTDNQMVAWVKNFYLT